MKSKSNPHSFSAGLTAALVFLNRAFALRSHNNLQFHGVFVAFRARDGLQLTISRLTGENKPAWRDHDLIPPVLPSLPLSPCIAAACLREGETPTNMHAVYQRTISPGAKADPAMAHVVKRRALRETTR